MKIMSSNTMNHLNDSKHVRRRPVVQRQEQKQETEDVDIASEIRHSLDALSFGSHTTQPRHDSNSSQLRMPQPRPLSYNPTSYSSSNTFTQSLQSTPERRPSSPPYYSSTPSSGQTSLQTTPRIHASQSGNAPLMIRAHSSPITLSPTFGPPIARSASPLRSPGRVRSPFRQAIAEEATAPPPLYSSATAALSPEIGSISEDAELEITPRNHSYSSSFSNPPLAPPSMSFPRPLRRRPASPLRSFNSSRASSVPASPHTSMSSSMSSDGSGAKFNETFPTELPYYYQSSSRSLSISSSMPSTPTSVRSRSPSISSLETIPDSPDAEMLATEEDSQERDERRRLWEQLYGSVPPASSGSDRASAGSRSLGSRDKRKRWSVCGAEKRSDLNLETIWEDGKTDAD